MMEPPITPVVNHEYVTSKELAAKIETVDAKLSALRAWGIAALFGGQALAAVISALITRTTPAEAGRIGLALLSHLPY